MAATLPLLITPRDEHARLLAWLVAVTTAGLAGTRFFLEGFASPVGWCLAVGAVGFAVVAGLLCGGKDRRRAMGLIPVIGLATIGAMAFIENGLASEAMFWLPLAPIIGAVTRGPGLHTAGFTFAGLAIVAALTGMELGGVQFTAAPVAPEMTLLRSGGLGGAVVAGGAIAWALDRAWKTAANTIAEEASHHPVTGLPSRQAFDRDLRAALARRSRSGTRVAVAYIDLDKFKRVNDQYGHQAGDAMLREVARRLKAVTRANEAPYHLAGDEFAVILEGFVRHEVGIPARRLVQALRELRPDPRSDLVVSASLGIAIAQPDDTAAGLVARADEAMYESKRAGGARASGRFSVPTLPAVDVDEDEGEVGS